MITPDVERYSTGSGNRANHGQDSSCDPSKNAGALEAVLHGWRIQGLLSNAEKVLSGSPGRSLQFRGAGTRSFLAQAPSTVPTTPVPRSTHLPRPLTAVCF